MTKATVLIRNNTWCVRFDEGKLLPLPVRADEMDLHGIKSFVRRNLGESLEIVNGMNEVDTKLNELRSHQVYFFGFAFTTREEMVKELSRRDQ